jgi:hypothetical protein
VKTTFGAFEAPAGSALVKESYTKGGWSGPLITCATYTRIFGTTDPYAFRSAVYRAAQSATWQLDRPDSPVLPTEGMTEVLRGKTEIVELGFWTSPRRMSDHVFAARDLRFDWTTYPTAAVLKVADVGGCTNALAPPVTRVSGHVTDGATGRPLANVRIFKHYTATDAVKSSNPLARECRAPWTPQPDGRCEILSIAATSAGDGTFTFDAVASSGYDSPVRLSFDAGPGYRLAWWRDASTWSDAIDVVLRGTERNTLITGIDARMEKR